MTLNLFLLCLSVARSAGEANDDSEESQQQESLGDTVRVSVCGCLTNQFPIEHVSPTHYMCVALTVEEGWSRIYSTFADHRPTEPWTNTRGK